MYISRRKLDFKLLNLVLILCFFCVILYLKNYENQLLLFHGHAQMSFGFVRLLYWTSSYV